MKNLEFHQPLKVEIQVDRDGHSIRVTDAYGFTHWFSLTHPAGEGLHLSSADGVFKDAEE